MFNGILRRADMGDYDAIKTMARNIYPKINPNSPEQFQSQLANFPEGQMVALDSDGTILGYSASLIVRWDDYEISGNWRDFTADGTFSNHDPKNGRTLYGADIMVAARARGRGVGKALYAARRQLARDLGLLRIRAGARLRYYYKHRNRLSATEYVQAVIRGELSDPTLTFQLNQGFRVLAVVDGYLKDDQESLGFAAVIEWLNLLVATPEDIAHQKRTELQLPITVDESVLEGDPWDD